MYFAKYDYCLYLQIAEIVGKTKEDVWCLFSKFAPRLESLQKGTDEIGNGSGDCSISVAATYWEATGNNLLQLAEQLDSPDEV